MPGHSNAALAAYPALSCSGEAREIRGEAGVFTGVYCAGNDEAFHFLEDVLNSSTPKAGASSDGAKFCKAAWRKTLR
jgi:hexosaminidase